MLTKLLGALPNVVAAFIIGFVGWLVASPARAGREPAGGSRPRQRGRTGLADTVRLSRIAGTSCSSSCSSRR
jgi:hypothetical protein